MSKNCKDCHGAYDKGEAYCAKCSDNGNKILEIMRTSLGKMNKAEKLNQLAQRGVGGEKANAIKALDKLTCGGRVYCLECDMPTQKGKCLCYNNDQKPIFIRKLTNKSNEIAFFIIRAYSQAICFAFSYQLSLL